MQTLNLIEHIHLKSPIRNFVNVVSVDNCSFLVSFDFQENLDINSNF